MNWQETLSIAERRELLTLKDGRAWLSIALDWALIGAAFALVALAPNPLTIVVAIAVIGSRQLGLAILMHEAAHRILLSDRRWNDWVGNWVCAYPVYLDVHPYRKYHLRHHARTWAADDPDLPLATPFPITRASLRRKIWRDLSGQTGWKRLKSACPPASGSGARTRAGKASAAWSSPTPSSSACSPLRATRHSTFSGSPAGSRPTAS